MSEHAFVMLNPETHSQSALTERIGFGLRLLREKVITCSIMASCFVISSLSLVMSDNLGKTSQTPKKASITLFRCDGISHPHYYNILLFRLLWRILLCSLNSVIFRVLPSLKTLMAPYSWAKFPSLAFKAFMKISSLASLIFMSYSGISCSARTDSLLAHKYSFFLCFALIIPLSLLSEISFLSLCFSNYINISRNNSILPLL